LLLEGEPPDASRGIDVDEQGHGTVTEQRIYQLVRQPKPIADREFKSSFWTHVETFRVHFRLMPQNPIWKLPYG
jgi:hypothetical protein